MEKLGNIWHNRKWRKHMIVHGKINGVISWNRWYYGYK